jgi:centrin-3
MAYITHLLVVSERYAGRDPEEEIKKAFSLFDDDHSGCISLKNMKRVARELGENLSEEELQNMIDEFDRDQDGEISMEEFMYIMKQSTMY